VKELKRDVANEECVDEYIEGWGRSHAPCDLDGDHDGYIYDGQRDEHVEEFLAAVLWMQHLCACARGNGLR
jgi:hypothetical protein